MRQACQELRSAFWSRHEEETVIRQKLKAESVEGGGGSSSSGKPTTTMASIDSTTGKNGTDEDQPRAKKRKKKANMIERRTDWDDQVVVGAEKEKL